MAERIKIDLKLRRCKRCGHWECTSCRTFCDDGACIGLGDPDYVFPEGKQPCDDDAECVYDEPMDVEGYKRFDAKIRELADDPTAECLSWFDREVGSVTEEDGSVFIVVGDRDKPVAIFEGDES